MDDNAICEVVRMSLAIGVPCSSWQAREALRPGRGYGNPQCAVAWLFTEGGLEALERQRAGGRSERNNDSQIDDCLQSVQDKEDGGVVVEEPIKYVREDGQNLELIAINDDDEGRDHTGGPTNSEFDSIIIVDDDKKEGKATLVGEKYDDIIVLDDDDDLENTLVKFANENHLHENVARNAALRVSSFTEGCHWMLTHPHVVEEPTPKPRKERKSSGYSETQTESSIPPSVGRAIGGGTGCWKCKNCTLLNPESILHCEACNEPSPFRLKIVEYEERLSQLKAEAMATCEELEACKTKTTMERERLCHLAKSIEIPDYWDPFPCGQTNFEVELISATGTAAAERDRIIKYFIDGGIGIQPSQVVSLKRIQNLPMWQRYAGQKALVAGKPTNKGNPNVQYLFHGPRTNTEAIIKNGFVGQYGVSSPYGTWTHTSSQYSGGSYADTNPPGGGRRIFICQAAVGTTGQDNGSGRCPKEVVPGILADCHQNGGIHVFYVDSQLYPEYLINWR